MRSDAPERRKRSPVRLPLWLLAILALLLLIAVTAGAIWLFDTVQNLAAASTVSTPEFSVGQEGEVQEAEPGDAAVEVSNASQLPVASANDFEPWSGEERINFLFMGVDLRCEEQGPTHTDSMMVVTVDPLTRTAALLSLPRDLWVEIPGFGVDRINQAYYFGQAYEYPGGGQGLAMETVETLLGIPVDYYLTIDFQGFIDAVDLIGGIVVNIPDPIDDPNYPDNCYGYEPFSITDGVQRIDGQTALKYARTRATFGGDVDRAQRQQEVLLAVRDQVLRVDQFPKLLVQAPQLWQTFQDNVNTNLSFNDAMELALLFQDIPQENIQTAILDYDYVYNETTPDGRQVLVPLRNEIRSLRDELFTVPTVPTPELQNLPQLMTAEDARVAVYNGTAVFGLAAQTESYLQDLNVNVTEIGNADSSAYQTSRLVDYGSHPNTVQFLIQEMRIPPLNLRNEATATEDYDVLIILGNDWAQQLTVDQ
jgi:LCP family protein required for cell wall assembly